MKSDMKLKSIMKADGDSSEIRKSIIDAWKTISLTSSLKNFIATNPLKGLEELPFEEAVRRGYAHFQARDLPVEMKNINRETIKWCQAFFDEGQSTITMPFRTQGLYNAWRKLARFDHHLYGKDQKKKAWLTDLPISAEKVISECVLKLNIPSDKITTFFTLMLTTLPGWASYVKCKTVGIQPKNQSLHATQIDYLAIRLVLTSLLWEEASHLLGWHKEKLSLPQDNVLLKITQAEDNYKTKLIKTFLNQQRIEQKKIRYPKAQLVFCIDVRSEPFRRELESQGNYETFGYAGFFGIPVEIKNEFNDVHYTSCPVLISPKHIIKEEIMSAQGVARKIQAGKKKIISFKQIYQSLKYTFTTPFLLVEMLGPLSGLWMSLRTFFPSKALRLKHWLKNFFIPPTTVQPFLEKESRTGISLEDQCHYAESALRMIGLTKYFSPLIVLCGHGSFTENNAYASALDCGACGGNQGAGNARILATILNDMNVRKYLAEKGILIPLKTRFIAALHNTLTDDVDFYLRGTDFLTPGLDQLRRDLEKAKKMNCENRFQQLTAKTSEGRVSSVKQIKRRGSDWAETRPEWGLARNASFIIGPRKLTQQINLEGRAFLHSYDWQSDKDGAILTAIMTAPLIVAQWINSQYLFSCLDNVAFGSGSKITQNIVGKMGIMQGNGSDLMHGLPHQSLHKNDNQSYHEPIRLVTIVYAPHTLIIEVVRNQQTLRQLFGNGWISLICIDPENGKFYALRRNLTLAQLASFEGIRMS